MSSPIISVHNLGKRYRLGASVSHDTLRDQLTHAAQSIGRFLRGKKEEIASAEEEQTLWALKDVSFDVQQGEVVAVIGRNGAGKSTLLKVLSQITEPTEGEIRVRGRIASLLEVGTGFHPELTGRENIFLNGAILGMKKSEIRAKFDSIVAFAEVEKFLDTPVKRYSSGMYVRLAFAVAAHLEPEILVVDEVLAVGDAQFQKKCLGKMRDVSQQSGRTILFVSHNMVAVKALCSRAVLLQKGRVVQIGSAQCVVDSYMAKFSTAIQEHEFNTPEEAPGNDKVRLKAFRAVPELADGEIQPTIRTPVRIECEFWNFVPDMRVNPLLRVEGSDGECIFYTTPPIGTEQLSAGLFKAVCRIPGDLLNDGAYVVHVSLMKDRSSVLFAPEQNVSFELADARSNTVWHGKWPGAVRPLLKWDFPIKADDGEGTRKFKS